MDLDNNDNFYQPSFFTIYLNSSKKYCDIFSSEDERHLFHEYTHFLEDISTTYGLACLSHVLNNIKSLYHKVKTKKSEGDYILCDEELDKITELNKTLFNEYAQYRKNIDEISKDTYVTDCTLVPIKINSIEGKIIDVLIGKVTFSDGNEFTMGEHAIMESISYILEKHAYDFPADKYLIPYDLPYLVWKYYLPEEKENIKALLDLEDFAMHFYNPIEVFIKTLQRIQSKEIHINTTFYEELNKSWKSDTDKSGNDLFYESLEIVKKDIDGVFKSTVYYIYKDWLLSILENVKSKHENTKPFFSEIYSNCDLSNHTEILKYLISKYGIPPVINADGDLYIEGVIQNGVAEKEWQGKMHIWILAFYSFLSSLAIYSVYSLVFKKEETKSCLLWEICQRYNELAKNKVFDTAEDCINNPQDKKINEKFFCPFSVVWNTFGLTEMGIF